MIQHGKRIQRQKKRISINRNESLLRTLWYHNIYFASIPDRSGVSRFLNFFRTISLLHEPERTGRATVETKTAGSAEIRNRRVAELRFHHHRKAAADKSQNPLAGLFLADAPTEGFWGCPRNFNTPSGRRDARADDCRIRQAAIKYSVPYLTTLAAAAAAEGIAAAMKGKGEVRSLQEYHANVS